MKRVTWHPWEKCIYFHTLVTVVVHHFQHPYGLNFLVDFHPMLCLDVLSSGEISLSLLFHPCYLCFDVVRSSMHPDQLGRTSYVEHSLFYTSNTMWYTLFEIYSHEPRSAVNVVYYRSISVVITGKWMACVVTRVARYYWYYFLASNYQGPNGKPFIYACRVTFNDIRCPIEWDS